MAAKRTASESESGNGLTTLSNHLWESANILRGPVDAADFKTDIFPLLFFKRISDVYDEGFQEGRARGDLRLATGVPSGMTEWLTASIC
jgi:type I restriction-modification system DNA methylase subunit